MGVEGKRPGGRLNAWGITPSNSNVPNGSRFVVSDLGFWGMSSSTDWILKFARGRAFVSEFAAHERFLVREVAARRGSAARADFPPFFRAFLNDSRGSDFFLFAWTATFGERFEVVVSNDDISMIGVIDHEWVPVA